MGLNTMAIIADEVLSDEQLATMGIEPTGSEMAAEDALLRSEPEHVCVVRAETYTAVAGYVDALAEAIETDRIALPGTVIAASSVSSVGFADFRVFVDGRLRRHLSVGDDESAADRGAPLPEESLFVFEGQDEELESEIDGDILINRVLAIAGVDSDASLIDGHGDAFAPISAAGEKAENGWEAATSGDHSDSKSTNAKKRFLRRFRRR